MSSLVLTGDTSGQVTLAAPAVAGSNTITLPAATATSSVNTLSTAVASTSGTSIDFTGLPSWVKRITVMFQATSLSGASHILVQIGAGSISSSGYASTGNAFTASSTTGGTSSTAGFVIALGLGTLAFTGHLVITTAGSNLWISSHSGLNATTTANAGGGYINLGGTLDRVRITTVNGTDTFDAGTINILYEG